MGQTASDMWEGSSRLVAWPIFVVSDFKSDTVGAVVGIALGGALVYYTYGNPVNLIESGQLTPIVIAYAEMGIGLTIGKYTADMVRGN